MDFGFLSNNKWLFLILSLTAVSIVSVLSLRKNRLLKSLNIKALIPRSSHIIFILALLVLSFTVLRPYFGKYEINVPSKYSNIIAAVDISDSMLARDSFPSRLETAKRELFDLISFIKAKNKPYKLGIVLFAGSAYSYCPATRDLDVVSNYIRSIDNKLIETGGSDIELGVKASIAAFKSAKVSSGQILILTDGEDEELNINGIKSALAELDTRIAILGIGESKAVSLIKNGRPIKDSAGNTIMSVLNENLLMQIASETGGRYSKAFLNDSDLKNILFFTEAEGDSKQDDTFIVHKEYSWILSMAILLILFILILFKKFVPAHFVILFFFIFFKQNALYAESPSKAAKLYLDGDYISSEKIFESLSQKKPEESEYSQAWGNALYRQKKFDQAESAFRASEYTAKNGREAFKASYNLGNALLMQQKYQEAIEVYEKSLGYKENDEKAKFNLELAKKMLEEQKKEEQEQEKEENKEQQENQDKKDSNQNQSEEQDQQNNNESSDSEDSQDSQSEDKQDKEDQKPKDNKENSEQKKNDEKEERSQQNQATEQQQKELSERESQSLEQKEAKAWLDSLSESPLLLRRDGFRGTPRRQTW